MFQLTLMEFGSVREWVCVCMCVQPLLAPAELSGILNSRMFYVSETVIQTVSLCFWLTFYSTLPTHALSQKHILTQ